MVSAIIGFKNSNSQGVMNTNFDQRALQVIPIVPMESSMLHLDDISDLDDKEKKESSLYAPVNSLQTNTAALISSSW